ncbi:hypothetical protein LPUS_03960 [Lasallia pustulata]|uniref:SigF-like NTF2-like domain-containing protein n=1 Tax=Lasallia pustulata TaxID=136370 RepID=A0A1W5CWD1_9LECA|nr:hypothetical protein LPUS_03960 [Lasallia pustulata]
MPLPPPGPKAFDKSTLQLYVSMHQLFRIWFVPFHQAPASLVTVLRLVHDRPTNRYYIQQQQDMYEPTELVKFFSLFRILWFVTVVTQFVATGLCVLGAVVGGPVSWVEENAVGGNGEKSVGEVVLG